MNDRIYVLAGNHGQSEYWRRRSGYSKRDWRYLNHPRQLAGTWRPNYVRIGTWYDRKDLDPIILQLTICDAVEVAPEWTT
jgi:hypothetical protein